MLFLGFPRDVYASVAAMVQVLSLGRMKKRGGEGYANRERFWTSLNPDLPVSLARYHAYHVLQ
jgi:hypothetical protein